jgi:hypothetical protein
MIILNILGITLLFIGNVLITYTIGKWGGRNMKQFRIGNVLQATGFAVSLIAIFGSI